MFALNEAIKQFKKDELKPEKYTVIVSENMSEDYYLIAAAMPISKMLLESMGPIQLTQYIFKRIVPLFVQTLRQEMSIMTTTAGVEDDVMGYEFDID